MWKPIAPMKRSNQLEAFAASGFDLRLDHVWLSAMVDYADAAVACGDPTYAWPLFERLAPWHAQLPATSASALPPVSHYLGGLAGVLGRYDEADAYFSQSAAMSAAVGGHVLHCPDGPVVGKRLGPAQSAG